jgi:hypothetical protein
LAREAKWLIMLNYEENERALKELFQDVKTVPNTLPPVYTFGEVIISYDREGHIKVIASTKSEQLQPTGDSWLKRWHARLVPLTTTDGPEQGLIDSWIRRWRGRRWRLAKTTDSQQQLGQV